MMFNIRYTPALVFWSIFGIIGFSCLTYWIINQTIQFNEQLPFNRQIDNYMKFYNPGDFTARPQSGPAKIEKILPINVSERMVDAVFFDLPERVRPGNSREVTAVAFLDWSTRFMGYYLDQEGKTTSKIAGQTICRIIVVELSTGKVIDSSTIVGDLPPDRIRSRESGLGPYPANAVANYLIHLTQP